MKINEKDLSSSSKSILASVAKKSGTTSGEVLKRIATLFCRPNVVNHGRRILTPAQSV